MAEYQYYEFRALDEPLDNAAQRALRRVSTRATITATSFTNHYNRADLRANPAALVDRYFDAFVHFTSWGQRQLTFRLPRSLVDGKAVRPYCDGNVVALRWKGGRAILDWVAEDEEAPEWDAEGAEWLPALLPLRDDLARGDYRALYLGFLLCVQYGEIDPDDREPPVPPGLSALSPSLEALVEFLRLDGHLVAAAAKGSAPLGKPPGRRELAAFVAGIPAAERDAVLVRLLEGEGHLAALELQARLRAERTAAPPPARARRTAAELLAAAGLLRRSTKRRGTAG